MALATRRKRTEILSTLTGVQFYGTDAVGVDFRQIEGKLWELKIRVYGNQHRTFYVILRGNEMILLHAYLKKTPRAPVREIEIAKQRMKQWKEDRK